MGNAQYERSKASLGAPRPSDLRSTPEGTPSRYPSTLEGCSLFFFSPSSSCLVLFSSCLRPGTNEREATNSPSPPPRLNRNDIGDFLRHQPWSRFHLQSVTLSVGERATRCPPWSVHWHTSFTSRRSRRGPQGASRADPAKHVPARWNHTPSRSAPPPPPPRRDRGPRSGACTWAMAVAYEKSPAPRLGRETQDLFNQQTKREPFFFLVSLFVCEGRCSGLARAPQSTEGCYGPMLQPTIGGFARTTRTALPHVLLFPPPAARIC